jgi:hypothetical protein
MAFRLGKSLSPKCAVLVGVLACFLPMAARASSCPSESTTTCFVNIDGNATSHGTGSSATLSLGNAELERIGNLTGANLGFISFTTGTLTSGSLGMGGTFGSANTLAGTFTIHGTYGNINNGTLFSGQFSGPVTWTLNSPSSCTTCSYTLSGFLSGTWFVHGTTVTTGATVQIDFTSTGLYSGGKITDVGGVSYINVPSIPEPASVGFVGTGLIAMGLLVRRKAKGLSSSEPDRT